MSLNEKIDAFTKKLGGFGKVNAATMGVDLPAADGIRYGGFTKRVYAFGLDSVFALLLLLPLFFFASNNQSPETLQAQIAVQQFAEGKISPEEYSAAVQPVIASMLKRTARDVILMGAVILAFWFYKAATPGKMIFGMEIVDAKTLGKPTKMQLFIRYIGYFVATLTCGLGFLWVIVDKRKRGLHDIMADTVVIYPKPLGQDWQKQVFKNNGYIVIAFLLIAAVWFYFFNK